MILSPARLYLQGEPPNYRPDNKSKRFLSLPRNNKTNPDANLDFESSRAFHRRAQRHCLPSAPKTRFTPPYTPQPPHSVSSLPPALPVFYHLLDGVRRSLDDLAGRDAVHHSFIQPPDHAGHGCRDRSPAQAAAGRERGDRGDPGDRYEELTRQVREERGRDRPGAGGTGVRKGRRAPRPPLAPNRRLPASSSERLSDWATQVPITLPSFLPAAKINTGGEPEGGCWRGAGRETTGPRCDWLSGAGAERCRGAGRGRGGARHLAARRLCGARGVVPPAA